MNPIDIIIITYQRKNDLKSLLLNIEKQNHKNNYLNKVVIIDNNSESDNFMMIENIKNYISYPIDYYKAETNLGVAKGRNKGIERSNAELLFFIDDDAEIQDPDSLKKAYTFISNQPSDIAIFPLKILYYENLKFQINAFPHKKFKKYSKIDSFLTYYFIGAGHIIRKSCLSATTLYPNDIFYGMEEYDLSYNLISRGYKILYTNCVTVLHKESLSGRQSNLEKIRSFWINKTLITYRYLPKIYFVSTCILWSIKFLYESKFKFIEVLKTYRFLIDKIENTNRTPLTKENISYLKIVEARLWY